MVGVLIRISRAALTLVITCLEVPYDDRPLEAVNRLTFAQPLYSPLIAPYILLDQSLKHAHAIYVIYNPSYILSTTQRARGLRLPITTTTTTMPDEKHVHLPIPTYEEATGSSATPSLPHINEASTTTERQGLLGVGPAPRVPVPTRRAGYRPPPTEDRSSARSSLDDEDLSPWINRSSEDGGRRNSEEADVRAEMEEMELLDPTPPASRLRESWTKGLHSISHRLSALNLPFDFRIQLPRLRMPEMGAGLYIILARIFAVFLVMGLAYLLFVSDLFTGAAQRMTSQMYDPESVRVYVQREADARRIRKDLEYLTSFDHVAGTQGDYVLAQYMEAEFVKADLENVYMEEFGVYLNYPRAGGRKVAIVGPDGQVKWEAKIEEEIAYPDTKEGKARQQTPVFHGHSKSGNATGPLIYANYGSREDFQKLHDSGIETTGAIALVRYYGSQGDRALKVKAAELAGFVGCLIYSDPADDGFLKGAAYPDGRYMPADGVQRGAVSLMSWVVGDVLTPGWASVPGAERVSKENNPGLNNIPSIPLAWRDAQMLLQSLKGFGNQVPSEWQGGVPDVPEWWTGNLSSPTVYLQNEQDEVEEQPIWNVVGQFSGIEQNTKKIIVGNHRDSWVFGASDPGSGTAVMLEVIRIFGSLKELGWRPLRTIEFASWDGEEYNLIGSTEHVESNMESLRNDGYAYLNVDVAVNGPDFRAAASPLFKKVLLRVLDRVSDPHVNQTLRQIWDGKNQQLDGLGAGSDYVAFQDMAGTSSLDFGFEGPPYPYHSAYDNFEWMSRFGDPDFLYHQTLAQIWALLILELADRQVLPFDMGAYSSSLTQYVMDLENWAQGKGANQEGHAALSMEPLRSAVLQFQKDAQAFEKWEEEWATVVFSGGGFENAVMGAHRMSHNNRMANFETHLLDLEKGGGVSFSCSLDPPFRAAQPLQPSPSSRFVYPLTLSPQLPGREQFKHILFAPQKWSGYDEAFFPSVRDAVDEGDWVAAQAAVDKCARILSKASHKLVGNT